MLSQEAMKIKGFLYSMKNTAEADIPLEQKRQGYDSMLIKFSKVPEGTDIERTSIVGIPCEWIKARDVSDNGKTILYIHGGSFFAGSLDTHRGFAASLSEAAGARALLFEYRLAPLNKFPAALEDTLSIYRHLLGTGVKSGDIIIGGDSCGAMLALLLLQELKEKGEPLPAGALLLSLFGDAVHFDGESYISKADADPISTLKGSRADLDIFVDHDNPMTEKLCPIGQDMKGLPALFIQSGSDEVALSDAERLAERARKAGVNVELEIWDGMWHCFQTLYAILPEARDAVGHAGSYVKRILG